MDLQIILSPTEIRIAIKEYLKTNYGVIQSENGSIKYLDSKTPIDQSVICCDIYETTKPISLAF